MAGNPPLSAGVATAIADGGARRRFWRAFALAWLAFWLLLFLLGTQEYFWNGGRRLGAPLIDYGTAAFVGSAVAVLQVWRARRYEHLLNRPLRWMVRVWAWLPFEAAGFVGATYLLRRGAYALAGLPFRHGPWSEVLTYEIGKFCLFYVLLGGIHFGLRANRAWAAARLQAEQQARLAKEAQLAQLTQQLAPHFLFNALNTISALIHADPDLADALLTRLATLLRAATDAGRRPEQPLADELALLEAYAGIMTQRFADRVHIDWAIDAEARRCHVPTLGLQPLLENCFVHGVERRRATTAIAVRARCMAGRLMVEVENDGEPLAAPPVPGVGLGNLVERMRSLHGDAARLELRPRPAGGLVVRMELPCAC
ncbi:MAG: histidine kinase [Proteobacteria bacterium]|nr:histidine kinase [Pseudomonadota bacterium]